MFVLSSEYSDVNTLFSRHSHPVSEIIYVKKGCAVFKFGDVSVELKEKHMILISALEEHDIEIQSPNYERYCFMVSGKFDSLNGSQSDLFSVFFSHIKNAFYVFDFSDDYTWMEMMLEKLNDEFKGNSRMKNEIVENLSTLVAMYMYRCSPDEFERVNHGNETMQKIQRYIDENFNKGITVADLASEFYLNAGYLSSAFKKYSGYSPMQYIALNRLIYAKKLLLTTNDSTKSIALNSGFSDVNNFIRTFKKKYDMTPQAFRKKEKSF